MRKTLSLITATLLAAASGAQALPESGGSAASAPAPGVERAAATGIRGAHLGRLQERLARSATELRTRR